MVEKSLRWKGFVKQISFYPNALQTYCKTLFFHHILILQFPYVENSLHFNLADFAVNFIKQFVSCFFWCLYQFLRQNSCRIIVYVTHLPRILHIISRKC